MAVEIVSVTLDPLQPEVLLGRNIESPSAGVVVENEAIAVVGWVLAREAPVARVEALIGGRVAATVPVDEARPDLAAAFPEVPEAAHGGFRLTVALGAAVELAVALRAIDAAGASVPLGTIDARRRWPGGTGNGPTLVSIIVTAQDQADALPGALESVARQTYPHLELTVVDAGSRDQIARVVAQTPGAQFVRIDRRSVAAARNAGFAATTGSLLVFLDAGDRLLPDAIEIGLRELAAQPDCAFVSGRARLVDAPADAPELPQQPYVPHDHYTQLLQRNYILNPAAVVYRRPALADVGLFDEELPGASDYDLYLRIAARYTVGTHIETVVEDRQNGRRAEEGPDTIAGSLAALERQGSVLNGDERRRRALAIGQRRLRAAANGHPVESASRGRRLIERLFDAEAAPWPPPPGAADLGDLRIEPLDPNFGYGRGTPIDRYYIESFLEQRAGDIAGRVLEVQENDYTVRFGAERVTRSDVVHLVPGNPRATIVGDLADTGTLPQASFDCVILTQTLHLVAEPAAALRNVAQALAPGGVLLLTAPGITQVEWGESWYWSFTTLSLKYLLEAEFGAGHVEIESHGNVHAATAFLNGLAVEETTTEKLDHVDLSYPVVLTARARRI